MHNLLQLTKVVKCGTQDVHIDPAILFVRLLVLVERSDDHISYFQYELTPYPASTFNGDYMRDVNKDLLGTQSLTERKKKQRMEKSGNRTSGRRRST